MSIEDMALLSVVSLLSAAIFFGGLFAAASLASEEDRDFAIYAASMIGACTLGVGCLVLICMWIFYRLKGK